METIAALELVVGFFGNGTTVTAAQRGTVRIETYGGVYGLNLETGQRVEPEQAVVHAPPLNLVTTKLERGVWVIDGVNHTLSRPPGMLTIGTDDSFMSCAPGAINVYNRKRLVIRSVRVPQPIGLYDRVTGGIQVYPSVIYVEPGFLVFIRSPALLVVSVADVERALVFDETRWAIQNILAVREPEATLPAQRGKWSGGVSTAAGTVAVETKLEPVRVRDLLWPPNGWGSIELADGSVVPAYTQPIEHRVVDTDITEVALSNALVPQTETTWPIVQHPPRPPQPPASHPDLRLIPQPTPNGASAYGVTAYAREMRLDVRRNTKGPLKNAIEQLQRYWRDPEKVLEWLEKKTAHRRGEKNPATPYLIPALLGLVCDPHLPRRDELLEMIRGFAHDARRHDDADVKYAFRLSLPLLLDLRDASAGHVACRSALVAFVAECEGFPSWWRDAKKVIRDLASLDEPGRLDETINVTLLPNRSR